MAEIVDLTTTTLNDVLNGNKPALILFTNGEGVRGDFASAFKKAADDHQNIVIARINTSENPELIERFNLGGKPIMIGWFAGQEVVRRSRPWGTDVPLAIEMLQNAQPTTLNQVEETKETKPMTVNDAPVVVTDATFQTEVIDYELPVLVDYWAPWCGPCRMVAPILDKLAKEFAGQIRIAKVNVDENPGLSQAFQIMSIPTIMLIKQQTIVFNQPGALPEPALRDIIKQLITLEIPPREEQEQPEPEATEVQE